MKRILILLGIVVGLVATAQTRLTINTGTAANDGSGDSLRAAFGKVNTNFATLWNTVYTNGTGGGGGTNYIFDTHWFSVSGTNVTIKPIVALTNDLTITNAAFTVYLGPLTAIQGLATNIGIVAYDQAAIGGGKAVVTGTTELDIATPRVNAGTSTNGHVLVLGSTISGASEFKGVDETVTSDGQPIINIWLKAWALSGAYSLTSASRDSDGTITTATIRWPDGSTGTFTTTVKNATFFSVDAYTITHTRSGRTVTQSTVTRDASGNITAQPQLNIN